MLCKSCSHFNRRATPDRMCAMRQRTWVTECPFFLDKKARDAVNGEDPEFSTSGWRCPKCGMLTSGEECYECGHRAPVIGGF